MITELKANTTYKLIDKDGWFKESVHNKDIYFTNFNTITDTVFIDEVDGFNDGCLGGTTIITEDERKFFEDMTSISEPLENVSEEVKPLTRTVYRKTTLSTKELLTEMLVNGKVYYSEDGEDCFTWYPEEEVFASENVGSFLIVKTNGLDKILHERVEEEVSWQEQLCEEFDMDYVEKGDQFVQGKLHNTTDMIQMAKRIIELSGTETKEK